MCRELGRDASWRSWAAVCVAIAVATRPSGHDGRVGEVGAGDPGGGHEQQLLTRCGNWIATSAPM